MYFFVGKIRLTLLGGLLPSALLYTGLISYLLSAVRESRGIVTRKKNYCRWYFVGKVAEDKKHPLELSQVAEMAWIYMKKCHRM